MIHTSSLLIFQACPINEERTHFTPSEKEAGPGDERNRLRTELEHLIDKILDFTSRVDEYQAHLERFRNKVVDRNCEKQADRDCAKSNDYDGLIGFFVAPIKK